ncbi:cellulose-binding protein [Rutstroemia sp. NJR-2017a WRK4]|nr:cellulose-binding protein [Rutstroemia sp. NJR-2017a WRK4]
MVSAASFSLRMLSILLLALISLHHVSAQQQCELSRYTAQPKVFVLTDMSNEPDDQMSLVRFLTYANEFDIQGIAGVTSVWKNDSIDTSTIKTVINAYGNVTTNLNANVPRNATYPASASILPKVHSGHPVYGLAALDMTPSDAALALVNSVDATTADHPIWLAIWGGAAVLAESLQHVSQTRNSSSLATFISKLRVYSISDQDDAGAWIRATYPSLFYIVSLHAFNEYTLASWTGISSGRLFDQGGPDASLVTNDWLQQHIRIGSLGAHYPDIAFIMEGDTPSFLPLIQNGLGDLNHPEWGSWGGRFKPLDASRRINTFTDAADYVQGLNGQFFMSNFATIWRWRKAYQYDFAARMAWTASADYAQNNHAPVAVVNETCGPGAMTVDINYNGTVIFDASASWDPDSDGLRYTWFNYRDVATRLEGGIPAVDDMMNITTLNEEGSIVRVKLNQQLKDYIESYVRAEKGGHVPV